MQVVSGFDVNTILLISFKSIAKSKKINKYNSNISFQKHDRPTALTLQSYYVYMFVVDDTSTHPSCFRRSIHASSKTQSTISASQMTSATF